MNASLSHQTVANPAELWRGLLRARGSRARVEALLSGHFNRPVVMLNAARSGLYLALAAHGIRRSDAVLVPPYLSQCVLGVLNRTAFPDLHPSKNTRAVIAYHQWGFPQKMDLLVKKARENSWLIVEDCAHAWGSSYQGRKVGDFGDAAVFSFPKFFPSLLGGCLVTSDEKILRFANEYVARGGGAGKGVLSAAAVSVIAALAWVRGPSARGFLSHALEMLYASFLAFPKPGLLPCALFPRTEAELCASLAERTRKWKIFRSYFPQSVYAELDEASETVPFLVPVFGERALLEKLSGELKRQGIETGVYHFDRRRNLLEPQFEACVPLPVHQGVSEVAFRRMCQTAHKMLGDASNASERALALSP